MTTCEDFCAETAATESFMTKARRIMARHVATIRRRMEIARAERHLRSMPDAMLKDLGIHRSEITAIAHHGRREYGR